MKEGKGRPISDDFNPDNEFQLTFRRYAPALWKFLWRGSDTHLFSGLTLRRKPPNWMVIVRADEIVSVRAVVVFGSASTIADALRNASLAISKNQWRTDKYASKQ